MPKVLLTLDFVSGLGQQVPAQGLVTYFDTELVGFVLEHRASGSGTSIEPA